VENKAKRLFIILSSIVFIVIVSGISFWLINSLIRTCYISSERRLRDGFELPPSYRNLHCVSNYEAFSYTTFIRFDMSPEDLDFVLSKSLFGRSFDVVSSPSDSVWNEFIPRVRGEVKDSNDNYVVEERCDLIGSCDFETIETYVYAELCFDKILIDTSRLEYYRVYLRLDVSELNCWG
jgi:hypothetical protein